MKIVSTFLKKIKNTFLTPRWNSVYKRYDEKFTYNNRNKIFYLILNNIWFSPYNIMSRYWHNASEKSVHSFQYYKELNYDAKFLLNKVKKYSLGKNSKILDLGCNVGRHLNFLKKNGYRNLYGVDIGKLAIKNSKKFFPNLKKVKIKCASFENYLFKKKDNFFEIIYSHGATLELIKPTFPLVRHMSRVLKKSGYLILLIDENGHAYPRFWRYEFKQNDLSIISHRRLNGNNTLFVLKKI